MSQKDAKPAAPAAKAAAAPAKPETLKFKVAPLRQPRIVTEIKRPDSKEAVLILRSGETVELTKEEVRILFHQDGGPVIPRDVLIPIAAEAPAPVTPPKGDGGGDAGGQAKGAGSDGNAAPEGKDKK